MFEIISTNKNIRDRLSLNVIPFNNSIKLNNTDCTKFIAGKGTLVSKGIQIQDGVFAVSTTSECEITGHGVVIEMPGYCYSEHRISLIQPGIPGHLSYIDGCSNSNLIDPARNGEPCLNYLYFPPEINQTFHTHPSLRIGFITSGSGVAETNDGEFPLNTGDVFILQRFGRHRFKTLNGHMSLIAFHPDSEDGPRDEFNPMKTRTHI